MKRNWFGIIAAGVVALCVFGMLVSVGMLINDTVSIPLLYDVEKTDKAVTRVISYLFVVEPTVAAVTIACLILAVIAAAIKNGFAIKLTSCVVWAVGVILLAVFFAFPGVALNFSEAQVQVLVVAFRQNIIILSILYSVVFVASLVDVILGSINLRRETDALRQRLAERKAARAELKQKNI